ncbi:lipoate--protein ligase [Mesoplasma entomophilum]|uniref:lipoate--protein ligase n=1 Tax=Mesoplasma entomophilum TaxID=2149 RepID=A0A3S5XZH0_9MOLU|nr:lipoate--protein ligase [Mesoplasma entomophilum]ATQ35201.1 lipoate--protein ligase [Mesoplasma entomophilum]ATZ19147.1 lipoate protein ligase A [Mesoplasma entomophilum]AVN60060.1 lipoate--protein ligase [Mesoplasma entomophilum]
MINLFISKSNDPAYNLAVEEYLTYQYVTNDPILYIWQNSNTIVVGRNQNTYAEINIAEAMKDEVKIIRRNTGGGTVFHDMGNVCYSLIVNNDKNSQSNFEIALQPIIQYLRSEGLNANFSGRNDIEIDGYKISGNAQLKTITKILQHGTLLFDVELPRILKYLNVDPEKIKHQKVKSKPARVANIKAILTENEKEIELNDFIENVINSYTKNDEVKWIEFNDSEKESINELFEEKYCSREWTFAKNEDFEISNKKYLETKGLIEIKTNVDKGKITNIKIYGDFLGYTGTEALEFALINTDYDYHAVKNILDKFSLKEIFGDNFEAEDILNLLFN